MEERFVQTTKIRFPGRRTFLAGNVVLLLFGAVHLLAVFNANFGKPPSEEFASLGKAAKSLSIPMGPFHPTAWGTIQLLNASYSVLLLYVSALNFVAMSALRRSSRLRTFTALQVVFTGLLLGLTIVYQFPPPMLFAGLAFLLFAISWHRQARVA